MNICARCDKPIQPGEKYIASFVPSATGPSNTIVLHEELCERPPTQTAPARPVRH